MPCPVHECLYRKKVSPVLSLGGEIIPEAAEDSFRFLGMLVRVHRNNNVARRALLDNLKRMLEAINSSPVTRQQKLCLYK